MAASSDGSVVVDGDRASMVFKRRLPHSIEVVWAALTEPDQRGAWFGPSTVDAREGGMIETVAEGPPAPREGRRMTGRILVWDPPHVLEHEWKQRGVAGSTVRYELVADGEETLLTFSHDGLRLGDAKGYGPGKHAFMDRLEAFLAGSKLPNWQQRYADVQHAYK